MKVLYYNWVDYLDDENRGGGVSQYLRNLMREIDTQDEIKATFLSSGISFDLINRKPRWERTRHGPQKDRARRFEIVNSGVLAPSHLSFGNTAQVKHAPTLACFFDFVEATGPYDVIHFNNLEGLPAAAIELKSRWPQMRVVLSLHNYYPFCSQVNLWHKEQQHCTDFDQGRKCIICLPSTQKESSLKLAHALAYRLKCSGIRPSSRTFKTLFLFAARVARQTSKVVASVRSWRQRKADVTARKSGPAKAPGAHFVIRRKTIVELLNRNCDRVLCVSESVRKLAEVHGLHSNLLLTQYIGTSVAEQFERNTSRPWLLHSDGTVSIGYLGYMRRDKGFFFLLSALEELPDDVAKRIRLVVAAKSAGADVMARLAMLGDRLAELKFYDGYASHNLAEILSHIDLGVIPVLWNDNLPQVAIEMHSHRIPLLTSDMGGARELSNCAEMVFKSGNVTSFHQRLDAVLSSDVNWPAYWESAKPPLSMKQHLNDLYVIYAEPVDQS